MHSETRTYDKHWIPWLRQHLEQEGVSAIVPLMPNPWAPDYEAFKVAFEQNRIGEEDVLIGHSCGGAFLVRWLGDTKQKIAKLILVAPWKIPDEGDADRERFYGFSIDESIRDRVKEIVIYTSNDEEDEGKESVRIFHGALGGKLIELKGHGHYTMRDMGTEEFPELLQEVIGR